MSSVEKLVLFDFLDAAFYRALHTATDTDLLQFFDHAKQITETCEVVVRYFHDNAETGI